MLDSMVRAGANTTQVLPPNRDAGKFSALRHPSPVLRLLFWLHRLADHL